LIETSALPWLAAASWVGYGAMHSLLAANKIKNKLAATAPGFAPYYRITFNLIAILLLLIPLLLTKMDSGLPLWQWPLSLNWLPNCMALLAVAGFIWSLKYYDLREFAGFLNKNKHNGFDIAKLKISPLHRFVRHPWYFFMLVIIWTREMNTTQLVSAVVITLYLIIGSRLEENKLIEQFGDSYRNYRSKVCGLIPLPWKILGKEDQRKIAG
jgi:methanethiol S-methyltransferase